MGRVECDGFYVVVIGALENIDTVRRSCMSSVEADGQAECQEAGRDEVPMDKAG